MKQKKFKYRPGADPRGRKPGQYRYYPEFDEAKAPKPDEDY